MDDLQDAKLRRRHQNRESQRRYRHIGERNRKSTIGRSRRAHEEDEDKEGSANNIVWQDQAGEDTSPNSQEREYYCKSGAASANNFISWPNSSHECRANFNADSNTRGNFSALPPHSLDLQPSMQSPQADHSLPSNLAFSIVPEPLEPLSSSNFNPMTFQMGMQYPYTISSEKSASRHSQSDAIQSEGNHSRNRNPKSHMAVGPLTPRSEQPVRWQKPHASPILSRGKDHYRDDSEQMSTAQNSTYREEYRVPNYHTSKFHRTVASKKSEEGIKVLVWPKAKEMVDEIFKLYEFGVKLELFEEDLALRDALVIVRKKFRAISKGSENQQARSSQQKGHTSSSEERGSTTGRHYESGTDTSTE